MKNTMRNDKPKKHGRGMKNCKKVPYSYIRMVCDHAGINQSTLAKMFGAHPGFFHEYAHEKRNELISVTVEAFLEAVYKMDPIPAPIAEFKFENFKGLCARAHKKIRNVCDELGYSDCGFRNVKDLTAGDIILIEKILNCTRDELVNGISERAPVQVSIEDFEDLPCSEDKTLIKKIFSTYTFAEIIKMVMEE